MANGGPPPQIRMKRRLPNELLAELCRAVVPLLGIWDDQRPPAAPPRRTSAILTVSASMYAYLRPKFLLRKAIEIEQREKCCQICAQLAWVSCRVGPNKRICIGCKCFFLRCLRDKSFAGAAVCTCSSSSEGTDGTVPKMCGRCRLNKCQQMDGMPKTMAMTGVATSGGRRRRTMKKTTG